jgi:hypothetical protein
MILGQHGRAAGSTVACCPIREPLLHLADGVSVMGVREICDEKMGWMVGGGCVESFAEVESAHSFAKCANEWGTRHRAGVGTGEMRGEPTEGRLTGPRKSLQLVWEKGNQP